MKKLKLALLVCLLSACSNLGDKFDAPIKPANNEALVYFYRPSRLFGSAISYDIKDNNKTVTNLPNGGYYPYKTNAGQKTFTARTESEEEIHLSLENGKTYFIRGKIHMGFLVGSPSLRLVDSTKALKEIQECNIVEN